ncbi:SDR family NAD(P)-dependent oxidoreductase [Pigmentibacter ruber]|uniref:SDR family NAD(P)-dependent oxidoreductase n=1 Tax=Pigmentibacter ruber TaxID=2683196 RepID=UPI00131B144C|nr:SDR family oxidoreductase [Pigmentibacter ruber]
MSHLKNLIINGGNSLIGKKLAEIEEHKTNVIKIVRSNSDLNENTNNLFFANAIDSDEIKETILKIQEKYQTIDQYVHLIGSIVLKPLHSQTKEEWLQTIDLNLNSIFYALKFILPIMIKQKKGQIVLVSSVAAQIGLMNHESISAAKGGVESLTRSLAITYSNYGIRVNCVSPSLTDTKMAKFLTQNEIAVKSTVSLNAIKRIGIPEDIAHAISFLLNDNSSFITGHVLNVDGGLTKIRTPPKI